jgi:Interferon-induced transmembrane protein
VSYGEPPGGQGTPGGPPGYGAEPPQPPGYGAPPPGYGAPPPYEGGAGYGYGAPAGAKPPTYRGLSITAAVVGVFFSLIFGLPCGIVASVYGRRVDTAWAAGDAAGAATASRRARIWLIVAGVFDAISIIAFIFIIAHGGAPSSTG